MSKKFYVLIAFGVFMILSIQNSYTQTNMSIVLLNGSDEKIPLTDIKTLRFINSGLNVFLMSGINSVYDLSQIKKITFKAISATSNLDSESDIQVFPNPVRNILFLKNAEQFSGIITIYTVDGRKILEKSYSQNEGLDVSSLSQGVYILMLNNQALKFSKQ